MARHEGGRAEIWVSKSDSLGMGRRVQGVELALAIVVDCLGLCA